MLDVIEEMDRVEIVAGADPAEAARERFESGYGGRAYPDHETLLAEEDDLDVVTVVSPHAVHFEQTMAALEAGLSVHVEKPMVTGIDDAAALTDAAADREEVVTVGYQRHFDPLFEELREIVADGIGELGGVNRTGSTASPGAGGPTPPSRGAASSMTPARTCWTRCCG